MKRPPNVVFAVALCALTLSCGARSAQPRQPFPPTGAAAPLDPRATELLDRCDAALRANASALATPRVDALAAMSRQRLILAASLDQLTGQTAALEARRMKAQKGLRALAQSEFERGAIAEALLDLADGRDPARPLSTRLSKREEYRDTVESLTLLRQSRELRTKIEAQISAIDSAFAMIAGPAQGPGTAASP